MLPPSFLGYKDLVVVTLGTGVGGGIIVNGKMLTGANGAGGEIGHIHVEDDEQEACGCGNRGCLEQYSSATGVTRLAKRKLEKTTQDSVLRTSTLSAKSVFDAVKAKSLPAITGSFKIFSRVSLILNTPHPRFAAL